MQDVQGLGDDTRSRQRWEAIAKIGKIGNARTEDGIEAFFK